ncbi:MULTISPECIES: AlbA family DNA-binding domain-containing protein [Methylomicrobium]|uniref:Putative transcriptional regulator with HTH domain n=1 Tax=Methylomicrobium album BG8 TaxID=686340 RepID=H8GJN4_METAL|nr:MULTISPECIES: ATP-binding protein [Methylomicrobium]EIC31563.1 putative transcriptional regulator with HTH domain [Methylomicrobium album BG8]
MKRFFILILRIWRQQLKLYLAAALNGALIGVLILAPSYDYISAREQSVDPLSSFEYMFGQIADMVMGRISHNNLMLLMFYAEIGAVVGLLSLFLFRLIHQRFVHIDYLKMELDKDLPSIIRQGEGPHLEFKSSLRWDMAESRINRALEGVILKTVAGFLNSSIGGTLLIGVADNGEVIGLEKDYQTLKRPDQDGFEQAVMTAISANLGADLCAFVHVLFHVIDGKHVCRLIVSPANRPVFVEQGNTQKFYVRTGGATRDLNIKEALDFIAGRWKGTK